MQGVQIRATEEAVLTALASYRFLTPEQMVRVGVTSSRSHLYATLRTLALRKPALVFELKFGALPGYGRLDRFYALTPRTDWDTPGDLGIAHDKARLSRTIRRKAAVSLGSWAAAGEGEYELEPAGGARPRCRGAGDPRAPEPGRARSRSLCTLLPTWRSPWRAPRRAPAAAPSPPTRPTA